MNDLEANVTKAAYAFQKGNFLRAFYGVDIKKNGESFATGKTVSAEKRTEMEMEGEKAQGRMG